MEWLMEIVRMITRLSSPNAKMKSMGRALSSTTRTGRDVSPDISLSRIFMHVSCKGKERSAFLIRPEHQIKVNEKGERERESERAIFPNKQRASGSCY
jgi:hypothetical protein